MRRRARDYFASAIHESDVPQKGTNMGVMILWWGNPGQYILIIKQVNFPFTKSAKSDEMCLSGSKYSR